MARKKTSVFDDIMLLASKAPWWVGVILAVVSYLVMHAVASRPVMPAGVSPGKVGEAVSKGMITTLAMFGQYLFPAAFGLGAVVSAITSAKTKLQYGKVQKRSDVSVLNEMNWEDFERLVGEYFRRSGYSVTRAGGSGPDGGLDLALRKGGETYLVQCKQWRAYKVGVQSVREFYGVMSSRGAAGGYFVTSGEYTKEAKAFVRGLNLELVDGKKLKEIIELARRSPEAAVASPESVHPATAPACPKCGMLMLKRTARKGSNAGKEFWGCQDFPKCDGVRSL